MEIVDLFFLLTPVYVTLFWSIVLGLQQKNNDVPKRFLGKFMQVALVVYISHLVYFTRQFQFYLYIDGIYILASLLVYPMYHIYVRLLTVDLSFSIREHLRYLVIPVFVFLVYMIGVAFLTSEEYLAFLRTPLEGFVIQKGDLMPISFAYNLYRVIFVLQALTYLAISYILISGSNERLKDFYSNPKDNNLGWIHYFNITLAVTSVASAALAIVGRERFVLDGISLAYPSIIFSIMLFAIGFLGLAANTRAIPPDDKVESPVSSGTEIDDSTEEKMAQKIRKLFVENKIYTDPNLKIWDVSIMLGTNRSYASHVINKRFRKNFRHLVNHYRLKAVIELLNENPG